eukprot:5255873-Amphidinium_carterae.1
METDGEQPDDTMGASAQSISSGSHTGSSIANTVVVDIKSMMWDTIVTQQCAPLILQLLLDTEMVPQGDAGNNEQVRNMTLIANTATIQKDSFIPTAAMNDTNVYLWFT